MENSILIRNITAEELQEVIRSVIKEELQVLQPKKNETHYLTRNEVVDLLKISLPTLHDYTKRGIVKGYRIGSRVLFKLDEIEQSIKSIEIIRYRRGY
jgi:excisionase family DNA binding protein